MVGRSNRARGACEATLYLIGAEMPAQVTERLRRHGVMALMEQERLLGLLERNHKNVALARFLCEAREQGKPHARLEDLRVGLGDAVFNRLNKGAE